MSDRGLNEIASEILTAANQFPASEAKPLPILKAASERIAELEAALAESIKLQSHYAALLNMHDGGERVGFESAQEWLERMAALKTEGKDE